MTLTLTLALLAYVTPDAVQFLQDYGDLIVILIAVVGAVAAVGKFFIVNPLRRYIDDKTSQVQTDANGGQSLKDLHDRTKALEQGQADIKRDLSAIYQYLLGEKDDS